MTHQNTKAKEQWLICGLGVLEAQGHAAMPLFRALIKPIRTTRFSLCCFLAAFGRCDLNTAFTVRCEDTMKPCQVNAWLTHRCCKLVDKIQRLEDDMCGTVAVLR